MMSSLASSAIVTVAAAAEPLPLGTIFASELLGTAVLCLLGCGVVANAILPAAKGAGEGP